ncbi:MAG TPA: GyrI-like domain-containing protein, partial [Chloroflexia bacterium]|nr:GyrI-like domain-containing protein [Chloroflexia bacterium]
MSETDTIIEAPGRSDVELLHLDPQPVMSIRETIKVADLAEMMGKWIPELLTCMQQEGAQPAGPLFVRYHTFGESETDMETGVPVAVHLPGDGRIEPGVLPGGPAASTWHVHKPHRALGEAYARLSAWCEQ